MKGFDLKKFLLALSIATVAAIGIGYSSGVAEASTCNSVVAYGPQNGGIDYADFVCDTPFYVYVNDEHYNTNYCYTTHYNGNGWDQPPYDVQTCIPGTSPTTVVGSVYGPYYPNPLGYSRLGWALGCTGSNPFYSQQVLNYAIKWVGNQYPGPYHTVNSPVSYPTYC